MKKILILTMALLMTVAGVFAQTKVGPKGSKTPAVVYTCPMHPEVISDKPGKCPKCGMTLVEKKTGAAPRRGKKDSASMQRMKM